MKVADNDVVMHFAEEFFKKFMLVDNNKMMRVQPVKFGKRNVSTQAIADGVIKMLNTFGIEYERAGYLFYMGKRPDTGRSSFVNSGSARK